MNPYHGHHRRLDAPTARWPQRFRAPAEDGRPAIRQTQASEDDDSEYSAQHLNGLSGLLENAEPEASMIPFSGPIGPLRYAGSPEREDCQLSPESAKRAEQTGRGAAIWRFVRTDPMLRNALFLTVNSGVSAGLGFAFWIITARLFSSESVGLGSSLTSASNLIVFLGLVGMNTTSVRYLPMAKYRDRLISAGVSLVTVVGGALALVCVVLLPLISRPLSFV